jgi:DNA polymerase-3 subunit beta
LIDTDVSFSPEDRGYIVHKKTVHLLKSLMDSKANDPVTLTFNEVMMNVELPGGGCISAKLIDHTYPDYTRVVPASSDNITVALGDGIRRLNAFSPNGMVKIGFDKSAISIKTSDGNEIEMPCQIKFADGVTPFDIGFNIKYLAQQQSLTQNFRLRGAKQGDPCVIDSSDPNAKWVIMPMRL